MWQQCPNCKGSGTTFYPLSHSTSAVCTVCKGYKIISELTGLPPISESVKVVSKNTQDADFDIEKQASIISLANDMFKGSQ